MSLSRLIVASLRYHWRTNLAVMLAVTAASAVLTGALVVGDSMRASLRHLLLDQLGRIDEVLVADRFFRAELADELQARPEFEAYFSRAVPAIYLTGTVENPASSLRAGRVGVIGAGAAFWSLGEGGPQEPPGEGQIVLNEPLAAEVGARVGDDVLLRIGSVSQVPADSALGRKTETIRNRRLRVSAIIPAEGLGRFALNPSQLVPLNAFVATETLQAALDQPGRVNAIFVAGHSGRVPSKGEDEALAGCLHPTLADFGLQIERHELGYWQLTSNRMLLDPPVLTAAQKAFAADGAQGVLTYLANTIAAGGREIPYSTITAIDFGAAPPLGPFVTPEGTPIGPLADDEIVLNTWAADDLGAKPGDEVEITYFEPDSTHGQVRESKAAFRLKAIVDLAGLAADPDLTPQLPGVTDQLSIGDWDPPFPFEQSRVRDQDEEYWDDREATKKFARPMYRTTPKAFVSLASGRRLWSSRFGDTTAVRFAPPPGPTVQRQADQLSLDPASLGFAFRPVKRLGLEAAQGTTAFDGLFIGFSLFIMVASLLLVALLFRLGIEGRAEQIGVLRAVGIPQRKIFAALAAEGLVVTAIGSLVGVVAGVGYGWLMIVGLTTWWVRAISSPFLDLYVTFGSLLIGFLGGLVVSVLTILLTLRRTGRVSVRRLLAGEAVDKPWTTRAAARKSLVAAGVLIALAAACGFSALALGGEAQAGAFVGSGALVLAAALSLVWNRMRRGASTGLADAPSLTIARLAARNGARHPTRSTLSIGLVAAASFLIVALSAFRLDPDALARGRDSGSGGFSLMAQSDQPIYQNLNSPAGRAALGFSDQADARLAHCDVVSLRVEAGDDASCLNLYQATQPRVLGAGESLVRRGGFAWGPIRAETPAEEANPWLLLDKKLPDAADGTPVVPAVVDFNTATYSLHKGLGDVIELDGGGGRAARLEIVAMLKNSVFQGNVLVGEGAFLELFPEVSGYRFFLIDTGDEPARDVRQALEQTLGDFGFDVETTSGRLAAFFAVQNTYLSTFQSLGGLGLLLGTFGLATVQLRSVLERRRELALMRATGFRRALLARMVMIENALLLVGGLAVGILAALVAVLPHWLGGGASVPWVSLAATLALVLLVGLAAGLVAVRATLRAELLPALREE
jgi:ABC-type antimicrobial peptide transport system permease subunit